MNISLSAFAPDNLVSRDGFGSPVPRQSAHLHTEAESGAYLRDPSRVPRWRPFIYFKPPYAVRSVPSLSSHAIAYRWRSLPIACRHRVSKPQGSSSNECCFSRSPWTNQYAALFPTPTIGMKWAMLKVPAKMRSRDSSH